MRRHGASLVLHEGSMELYGGSVELQEGFLRLPKSSWHHCLMAGMGSALKYRLAEVSLPYQSLGGSHGEIHLRPSPP